MFIWAVDLSYLSVFLLSICSTGEQPSAIITVRSLAVGQRRWQVETVGGTVLLNKTWKNFSTISFSHSLAKQEAALERTDSVNMSTCTTRYSFSGIYNKWCLFYALALSLWFVYCVLSSSKEVFVCGRGSAMQRI